MKAKKAKQEIRDWLLENATDDEGNLDLSDLDFSNFNGNVLIDNMKVKKSLSQRCQEVGEDLQQDHQKVGESLRQHNQKVGKYFYNHKLNNDEYWEDCGPYVIRTRKKEITLEELEKMGFKLKEEK